MQRVFLNKFDTTCSMQHVGRSASVCLESKVESTVESQHVEHNMRPMFGAINLMKHVRGNMFDTTCSMLIGPTTLRLKDVKQKSQEEGNNKKTEK